MRFVIHNFKFSVSDPKSQQRPRGTPAVAPNADFLAL
jgi:hypothetical protein